MRKNILLIKKLLMNLFVFTVVINSCTHQTNLSNEQLSRLKEIYDTNNYFSLRKALSAVPQNNTREYLYYSAVVNNAFNKPLESNKFINKLIELSESPDSLTSDALVLKINNHVRLGNYKEAYEAINVLVDKYSSFTDSLTLKSQANEQLIWEALIDIPTMTVNASGNSSLKLEQDKAGLDRIPIQINGAPGNFVFDTGANFSVIQRSVAERNNVEVLDANFEVSGFTGMMVESDVAVAKEIVLGNHVFRNVIFLVFDDETLTFPQFDYSIEGIIGFPVLEAAKEIQVLTKENVIEIPEKINDYTLNNLAMDGFTPLIQINYEEEELLCTFDTGADKTTFYSTFTKKYKSEFNSTTFEEKEFNQMGAGGAKAVKGFEIPSFSFEIGGQEVTITDVRLFSEEIATPPETRYANIGQDVVNQFDKMILNFNTMTLIFE